MNPKQRTASRAKIREKVARCRANKKLREAAAAAGGPAPKVVKQEMAPHLAPQGEAGAPGLVAPDTRAPDDKQAATPGEEVNMAHFTTVCRPAMNVVLSSVSLTYTYCQIATLILELDLLYLYALQF